MSGDSLEARIAQVVREAVTLSLAELRETVVAALCVTKPVEAEWLSTADVARELGVKAETVRDYIKRDKLHASRVERTLRVHRDEVRRFLAGTDPDTEQKVTALTDRLRAMKGP